MYAGRRTMSPRSSGDRAPPSGGGSVGSNPTGGTSPGRCEDVLARSGLFCAAPQRAPCHVDTPTRDLHPRVRRSRFGKAFPSPHAPEEANSDVAESVQDNQPSTRPNPMADFGANEWLVDEMYERYQEDPNSVDRAWWEFFKSRGGGAAKPAAGTSNQAPEKSGETSPEKADKTEARPGRPRTSQPTRQRRRQRPRRRRRTRRGPPPASRTSLRRRPPRRPPRRLPRSRPPTRR